MRKIKFRAWDTKQERYYSVDGIFWDEGGYIVRTPEAWEYHGGVTDIEPPEPETIVPIERCIIEQFTGLKDKKGEELYRNDLINNGLGRICQIVWHEKAGMWDCEPVGNITPDNSTELPPRTWPYRATKVGTVHENPELLERKE